MSEAFFPEFPRLTDYYHRCGRHGKNEPQSPVFLCVGCGVYYAIFLHIERSLSPAAKCIYQVVALLIDLDVIRFLESNKVSHYSG
jgi:hypothetical protein